MTRTVFMFLILIKLAGISKVQDKHFSGKVERDTIFWTKERKLAWNDFKGIVPKDAKYYVLAKTFSGIRSKTTKGPDGRPTFRVESYFIPSKSWSRTSDEQTLLHEQLHFDISEIYARRIRKAFDSLKARNVSDIKIYEGTYREYVKRCFKTNDEYDDQVYYDSSKQKKWKENVTRQIEDLKAFSSPK